MRKDDWKRAAVMIVAGLILSGSASALFEKGASGPVARDISLTTYRDIPCTGQFRAEGEERVSYALVDAPRKGSVTMEGDTFTYTPKTGVTGTDRFTYTATDGDGNASPSATVRITIQKPTSGVFYADTDARCAWAAQELAERGIFIGARLGDQWYFEPERSVSRSEFLAMTMELCGREVSAVTMTGFSDDAAIPTWAKAYVSAGVAEGILQGSAREGGVVFRGSDAITLQEAATMLNRVLTVEEVDLVQRFGEEESVPAWAAQAVGNLEAAEVLSAGSFGSAALSQPLNRGESAKLLCAAAALLPETKGIWDYLR